VQDIQEIAGVVPDAVINEFANTLGLEVGDWPAGGPRKTIGFEAIRKKVKELMREGFSASQTLFQVSLVP
jgi:replication factor C subunit 2/4